MASMPMLAAVAVLLDAGWRGVSARLCPHYLLLCAHASDPPAAKPPAPDIMQPVPHVAGPAVQQLSVVYGTICDTSGHSVYRVREVDALAFWQELPDFIRVPWKRRTALVDDGLHGALTVQPPLCLVVDRSRGGGHKKERRLNDRKTLNAAGLLALQRHGSRRKEGTAARDTVVWRLEFRCCGTPMCQAANGRPCPVTAVFEATVADIEAKFVTVTVTGVHHPEKTWVPPAPADCRMTREERDSIRDLAAAGTKPERARSMLKWTAERQQGAIREAAGLPKVPLPKGSVPSKRHIGEVSPLACISIACSESFAVVPMNIC